MFKSNSKPQEKKICISTKHYIGEINCQTLKKKDSFWNNIPPGNCDPYMHLGHIALGDYYEQMLPLFCKQSGGMIDIVLFRKHLLF